MINFLYIGTSPEESNQLDLRSEQHSIKKQCDRYPEAINWESLICPTLAQLLNTLKTGEPHIIHFGGHISPEGEILLLRTKGGDLRSVTPNDFQKIINAVGNTPKSLILLQACYGKTLGLQLQNVNAANCIITFGGKVNDTTTPEFVGLLYELILSGELIEDALQLANITVDNKAESFWSSSKRINGKTYRLTDPNVEPLQEGRMIEGKHLVSFLQEDDLGQIWLVRDGDNNDSDFQIRRFLHRKIESVNLVNQLSLSSRAFSKEEDVLIYSTHNLTEKNLPYPFIEYKNPKKLSWKPLTDLLKNKYPLDSEQIEEVNSIVLQLTKAIDIAHQSVDNLIHGRLNPNSIIVLDRHNMESTSFGNLRPIITDFGLQSQSSRMFKNTSFCMSPWVKSGNLPRKTDDVYSIICVWFWLLTGKDPSLENIENINTWFPSLNIHNITYDIVDLFLKVVRNANQIGHNLSTRKLADLIWEQYLSVKKKEQIKKGDIRKPVKFLENSIGMKFVLVESNQYEFGSAPEDPMSQEDEYPKRQIFLSGFYISQCVMSIEDLLKLADKSTDVELKGVTAPLKSKTDKTLPATSIFMDSMEIPISWQFAKRVCGELKKLDFGEGLKYFLPTEAQWEIACRAATKSVFNNGFSELSPNDANFKHEPFTEDQIAFQNAASSTGVKQLMPVDAYSTNKWHLHQMHGNVWEFCEDYYADKYDLSDDRDPKGFQPRGQAVWRLLGRRYPKVIRGGDLNSFQNKCRSSSRAFIEDKASGFDELHIPDSHLKVGIRLVCYKPKQR